MEAVARPASWFAAGGLARAGVAVAVVAFTFVALWPTTDSLSLRWMDTVNRAYTHGTLVPLIVAFLIWRRRDLLAQVTMAPSRIACIAGLFLAVAWLVAVRGSIQIAHQALLPLIAAAAVWAALGRAAVRVLALPLAYLYFTIPLWDAINPALQWLSAFAVRGLLSLIGIPVYFDGLNFQIPAGVFEIAGGCSGLHFFIVAAAVSVFYGELHRDRLATRLKLVALALLFALLTNWLRIAIIIHLGHQTDMQHPLVADEHYSFGWGMFAVAMVVYFLIVRRWEARAEPAAVDVPRAQNVPAMGVAMAAAVLALPAAWYWLDDNRMAVNLPADQGDVASFRPGAPVFAHADFRRAHSSDVDGVRVDFFNAIYREQTQGREIAGYENQPEGPDLARRSQVTAPNGRFTEIKAQDDSGQDWLIWRQYRIDGREFVDGLRASVYYGALSLWRDPESAVEILRSPCLPDCPAARARLDANAVPVSGTTN